MKQLLAHAESTSPQRTEPPKTSVEGGYLVFEGSSVMCCAQKHRVKSDELEDRVVQGT